MKSLLRRPLFLCRLNRSFAVEYSFLASIPVIFGAFVYETLKNKETIMVASFNQNIWFGMILSAVSGWLALKWLLHFLETNSLIRFSIYCALIGGISLAINLI